MEKFKKIYVKFGVYADHKDKAIVKRYIEFCFLLKKDFKKGFCDLIQKGDFDWFNNHPMNRNLSLNDGPVIWEKGENLKKYHSIYDVEKIDDIEDILNFLENPKDILTVRTQFYFKGNRVKSLNFILYPLAGSLLESQLYARHEDMGLLMTQLNKKEKMGELFWQKMDREGVHVKSMSALDYIFNLNDPNQVKKLFDSEFWLKFSRKSLNVWRKK